MQIERNRKCKTRLNLRFRSTLAYCMVFFVLAGIVYIPSPVNNIHGTSAAGPRYWVGGCSTTDWNCTSPITNWGTASNTQDNASVPDSTNDVIFDGVGTGASNSTISAAITIKSLDMTGYTNTLTHNAFVLTVAGSVTLVSGMIYTPLATSTITLSATGTFTTGGKLIPLMTITAGTTTLGDNLSFMASKVITLTLSGNVLDLNGKTVAGDSATNRLLVQSNTIGTARTITINSGTFANVDFKDITASSAIDLSVGLAGDAGGNSGITFTTGATQYWVGGTGNWSTAAEWGTTSGGSGGRVPLPQDDVVFDANSFSGAGLTVTQDMPRAGKNINWTGVANTPTWTTSTTASVFGSLTLVSGMTLTASSQTYTFEGRGSYTLTSAGKSWSKPITLDAPGGTLTLQDDLTITPTNITLLITRGTFNANNSNVTVGRFNSTNSNTRTITMGSGTWSIIDTAATTVWNTGIVTNLTLNANTSTIKFTGSTANIRIFVPGGLTFNNFWFSNATANGGLTVTGNNTFNDFKVDGGTAQTIRFAAGSTQTVSTFTVSGTAGNLISLDSSTTGTYTLTKAGGGVVSSDYLNIQHSVATPASTWYAGANSTNNQGVATAGSGWIFTPPPVANVTTLADGTDPSNSTVAPSSSITDLDSFTLSTDSGTDSVTVLTVTLANGTYAGLSEVKITSDNGSTTYFSAVTDPSANAVNFSGGTPIPVTTTPTQFKVRITPKTHGNMTAVPGSSYAATGTVTSFTSTNTQAGSDTDSATITVDNLSPANITGPSGTVGNTEVALTWTNPVDADFSKALILQSTAAVADTPTEGSSPIVGATIGASTVVYILNGTSFTDTGLTNGIAYHYKIFTKDSNGNFSQTGVVPTGSPFTPIAPSSGGGGGGGQQQISPTVSIIIPISNATVSGTTNIDTATDNVNTVEFYIDGALLNTDSVYPFSYAWDTKSSSNGFHTITAKAFNYSNTAITSSTIKVTVNNQVIIIPPPPVVVPPKPKPPVVVKPSPVPTPTPVPTPMPAPVQTPSPVPVPPQIEPPATPGDQVTNETKIGFWKKIGLWFGQVGNGVSKIAVNIGNGIKHASIATKNVVVSSAKAVAGLGSQVGNGVKNVAVNIGEFVSKPWNSSNEKIANKENTTKDELEKGVIIFRSGDLRIISDQKQQVQTVAGFNFIVEFVPTKPAQSIEGSYKFSDADGDGVWTAQVRMPEVVGEFQIHTKVAYVDGGSREFDTEVLIDPEGYIFVQQLLGKTRIENAQVTLFQKIDNEWVAWEAEKYNQINPQITKDTGEYSFLAPAGTYYVEVTANNYAPYYGKPFELNQTNPIHQPIELKYEGE